VIQRDEPAQHFTRRLEAFSDIVIGFSLAQLGASLTLNGGRDFFANPDAILGFLFPFAIICSLWFFHHRLFAYVFVPKTLPVILNFVWLAAVVLLVFAAESYMGNGFSGHTVYAYFACYAFVYAMLAVQNMLGMRYAKERQDWAARVRALRGALFMGVWTFPFLWSLAVVMSLRPGQSYGLLISIGFILAGAASPVLASYVRKVEAGYRARTA
jgi:uncharacterized membrane protein